MIVKDGKIIEATRGELYKRWLNEGWSEIVTFPDHLFHLENAGVTVKEVRRTDG